MRKQKKLEKNAKPNARFMAFAATLDYLEVLRVTVKPDGSYCVPSLKDGRITLVNASDRRALAKFLREVATGLAPEEVVHQEPTPPAPPAPERAAAA